MVPSASEESTGHARVGYDPLRHAVHVALAVYLMPVVAIVCAIGGASIVFDRASRLAARLAVEGRRGVGHAHLPIARSGQVRWAPATAPIRRRTRMGR
jgi:hypothetical protein